MRTVVKSDWLELVHKLWPKKRLTAGVHGWPRVQSFRPSLQETGSYARSNQSGDSQDWSL